MTEITDILTTIELFNKTFDEVFIAPSFKSKRVFELWLNLEIVSVTLAGPLYNILNNGDCNYVYTDKENRLPGVINAI